jgi:acyl-CoA synthetase (AMP-forming)/AMP-acid ligase II
MTLHSAERYGDAPAVIDGDGTLTFNQVASEMVSVAGSLVARGVEPGDRVALWAPNSARWITAALGVLASGARLVPLNTRFKGTEAAYILNKSRARSLLCANGFLGAEYVDMVRQADPAVAALDDVAVLQGPVPRGAVSWDEFLAAGSNQDAVVYDRIAAVGSDDVSDVIFTSGTTGHPKGVLLRHGTSLRAYAAYNEGFRLGQGDRILIVLPFFHTFGYKAGWMLALMVGATTFPIPAFDPAAVLKAIDEHSITHFAGAPTIFSSLLDSPALREASLSSLRVAVVSAAYVPVELVHRMNEVFGLDYCMTGYGLAEAHGLVAITYPDDPPEVVANWCGRPIPDTAVRLVDDEGVEVGVGERGEILFRGYNVADGYLDESEASAGVFGSDGWLRTGDIAYMNAAGYLKVCDRKKDMYITGGFNVAPAEVEGLLSDWDKIAAAAVISVPDDHFGEVGAAFVVPARGAQLHPDDVIDHARVVMANYKVPRRVYIVDSLPLNATGKVVKDDLRARLLTQDDL